MTTNDAIKVVEEGIRQAGLNIRMINRLDIIKAAEELVTAQGNDLSHPEAKIIPFH